MVDHPGPSVRETFVAGSFYPEAADELRAAVYRPRHRQLGRGWSFRSRGLWPPPHSRPVGAGLAPRRAGDHDRPPQFRRYRRPEGHRVVGYGSFVFEMGAVLAKKSRATLLDVARKAIRGGVENRAEPRPSVSGYSDDLLAPRATFVTLTKAEKLRACIGSLVASQPLIVMWPTTPIGRRSRIRALRR